MTFDELVAAIQGEDEQLRTDAWHASASVGAPAVEPLAELCTDTNLEVARAAMRGLWAITREAGRPGAEPDRAEVVAALATLTTPDQDATLRRNAVWMLSEIGDDSTVPLLADLLSDATLREDARMALERIPGEASLAALREGLAAAGDDFKPPMAHSLRVRGDSVPDIPDMKRVPQKPTAVTRGATP